MVAGVGVNSEPVVDMSTEYYRQKHSQNVN
jgi:hypothetical protein